MENKSPLSFRIFIISLCATLIVFVTATILASNPAYRKYAVLSAPPTIFLFTFSVIGIFNAATKKYETRREKIRNRIGLFGNLSICLLFLSIIIGGTVVAMRGTVH
ncbi:hypothetical protein BH11BAC7_BH11BAC7_01860 [soil metagenome]